VLRKNRNRTDVFDDIQRDAEMTEEEKTERAELVQRIKAKTDGNLTFNEDQVSSALVTLKDSTITLSSLVIAVRERRICQGREPRAMYGALFDVGETLDWTQMAARNRPTLVDDHAVQSWLLLSRQKDIPHTVGVVLARRDERTNTPTFNGSPHIVPAEHVEFAGSEPCYDSAEDALATKRKPYRKLGRADTYVARIEKIGQMKRRDKKFLEDTVTHARATATKGNQPMQTAHKCCSGKEDFYTYKSATQQLRPLLHPDLWMSTLHEVN
jgi:hypothetical protein